MYEDQNSTGYSKLAEAKGSIATLDNPLTRQQLMEKNPEIFLYYSQVHDGREIITMPSVIRNSVGVANDQYVFNLYHFLSKNSFESVRDLHARVLLGQLPPQNPVKERNPKF